MKKLLLSHALYQPGMDVLKDKVELIIPNEGDSDKILPLLKEADGFILRIGKIDRKAIEACPNLRVIVRPGVGVDNVDVQAATEHGIPVVVCPAANAQSVAEHALALMFAVSKSIVTYAVEARKGNFAVRNRYAAVEMQGKSVAVLGFGNIGRRLAAMARGVGMQVAVYDPFVARGTVEGAGYAFMGTLEEALASADYVSLHMPSLPETRGMIGEQALAHMRPTAYLINCARGDIVDEAALATALRRGVIAGAGLDVLGKEPFDPYDPLMSMENVVITPHSAAQTQEATRVVAVRAAEGALAVLNGEQWNSVCNPEAYKHPRWRQR